jgi:hypothetical protein
MRSVDATPKVPMRLFHNFSDGLQRCCSSVADAMKQPITLNKVVNISILIPEKAPT